jgi:hypothetical protein
MLAAFRIGLDGEVTAGALVDSDNFVRRLIIDCE